MSRSTEGADKGRTLPPTSANTAATGLDERVLAVLSVAPEVSIPDHFAAMVAQQACAQPLRRAEVWPGWGPRMVAVSGVLMTAGLFAVAPHAAPSWHNGWFDTQILLLAELGGLLFFAQRFLIRD